MDNIDTNFPRNNEELFIGFIEATVALNSEFGEYIDNIFLYCWAEYFALKNGLAMPSPKIEEGTKVLGVGLIQRLLRCFKL